MERETKKNKKKVQNRKIFTRFSSPSSSFSKKTISLSFVSSFFTPFATRVETRKKKKYSRQSLRSPSLIPPLFSISLFLILHETILRNERHTARNGKDGGWKEEARSEGKEAKGSETRRRRTERAWAPSTSGVGTWSVAAPRENREATAFESVCVRQSSRRPRFVVTFAPILSVVSYRDQCSDRRIFQLHA